MITPEQKKSLKEVYKKIATLEEVKSLEQEDLIKKIGSEGREGISGLRKILSSITESLSGLFTKVEKQGQEIPKLATEGFKTAAEPLGQKLDLIKTAIYQETKNQIEHTSTLAEAVKSLEKEPIDLRPVVKRMDESLSAMKDAVNVLPSKLGTFPQYFGLNNASFAPINPATAEGQTSIVSALPTNYSLETDGNLATLAGKDFATQTTLALIKAKTDNLDVLLSTRTKPADSQTVTGTVDTELPAAAALATGLSSTPTVPRVGADMLGRRSDQTANTDPAILATTYNPAGSGTPETAIGVSFRKKSASGASTEYGTTTSPFITQPMYSTRSDVFTTTTSGTTVDVSSSPLKYFSLQVVKSGAVTVWDIRLEGSIDGTNFTQILQHTNVTGDLAVVYGTTPAACRYFRSRCAGITGGTNLTAYILGVN